MLNCSRRLRWNRRRPARDGAVFIVPACMLLVALFASNQLTLKAQAAEKFPLQLDHVFLWVTKGAPEAAAFENAGLQLQDRTNQHTGQGTASKVFIFENVYLELIWIDDEQAAAKNAARSGIDMPGRARWKETGASPFGVGLHRLDNPDAIPFPVTHYWAEWMQPNTIIEFAQTVTNNNEPMFFVLPDYLSTDTPAMQTRLSEALKTNHHRLGVSRLTQLRIVTVSKKLTATSERLTRGGVLKIERGKTPLLELTFDGHKKNKSVDLRPAVPIVLKY